MDRARPRRSSARSPRIRISRSLISPAPASIPSTSKARPRGRRPRAARELVARRGTEREKSHVETLALAIEGQLPAALSSALKHLESWPRDAVVLSLPLGAFGLFAFSGMADHDQARQDLCERHAPHYGEDWWFLSNYGWSMTENGQVAKGRAMTERGFELRRQNAYAAHALLHAMFEDGSVADADALVDAMDRRIRPRRHPAWPHPLASGARRARGRRCGEGAFDLCGRAAALRQCGAAAECDVRLRLAAVAAASLWPCRSAGSSGTMPTPTPENTSRR